MSVRLRFPQADWLFAGVMFGLCAVLTVLQYRWTGEIARAETVRLRGNLDEQARTLAHTFDAQLSASCDQLIPQRQDFADQSREAAHLARFKEWKAGNPRPIFRRIGLAVMSGGEPRLSLLDQSAPQFVPASWPSEWMGLREGFLRKGTGGPPPSSDERGVLLEFPVFAASAENHGEHWLVLELDLDYARDHWLPELINGSLNPGGRAFNEARVKIGTSGSNWLCSATSAGPGAGDTLVSVRFNTLGRTGNSRVPGRGGGRWLLEAWQPRGALEAIVSASQRRNLSLAVGINLLMLATSVALIQFTRRSRRLAEQQMGFVAGVSHEFRTPLTVIRGAAHNLKRGVVSERGQIERYAGLIIEQSEQLGEMLEQVLALAGAQKNTSAQARQSISVEGVLREAITATSHETGAAGCEVHLESPSALPAVAGNPAALRLVFQNLIVNAAKHGGSGQWIGITAAAAAGGGGKAPMIEIRVADRGPGILPGERSDIFKPFFRGARAQADQIRGSGLGLSLVKETVEAHGGTIFVHSPEGGGAEFIVRLPCAPVGGNL